LIVGKLPAGIVVAGLAVALATGLSARAATGKTAALLVGVSKYDNLKEDKWLRAPKTDVERMVRTLKLLGARLEDMEILADGVDASRTRPTFNNINDAFARLAGRAGEDDHVVIYMSGHGTQIPDDNGDEEDGLDEAFLPADAIPPPAGAARFDVGNAIRDDRIGELIDALRAKGAHVWLIADSCHSGTISRAATQESRAKEIGAKDFNTVLVPAAAPPPASQPRLAGGALSGERMREARGSLVAFYGSQDNEISLEIAMPPGAPENQQTWVSAFTDALITTIERGSVSTYRDLLADVSRSLRMNVPPRTRQTPGFDGDALDRPVLGGTTVTLAPGHPVEGDVIVGGLIAGFEPGTVVALYGKSDASANAPIGHAQVTRADQLGSRIVPVSFPCERRDGVPVCNARDDKMLIDRARYARLIAPITRAPLRVSHPRDWPGRPPVAPRKSIETAVLNRISGDSESALRIDDERPDFVWYRTTEGYRFVPGWISAAEEEFGPAMKFEALDDEAAAAAVLAALERARLLLRLDRVRQGLPSNAFPIGVATAKTSLVRYEHDGNGRCRFSDRAPSPLGQHEALSICDGVVVDVRNAGHDPVFVTVFVLDDGWNLIPQGNACRQGAQNRLAGGGTRSVRLLYGPGTISPGNAPRGRQGVIVLAVPFRAGEAMPFDPCRLAGPATARAIGTAGDTVEEMLGGTPGTRSVGGTNLDGLVMSLDTWPLAQGGRL
jgi:uncharacterized caspase-like protein